MSAATEDDAVEVGRAIARNNLFKAAVFGNDPNWGRVLAAIGTTRAAFDPYDVDVVHERRAGVREGRARPPSRRGRPHPASSCRAALDLHAGHAAAIIFTNDLTHDYVHENSAYAT